MKINNFTKCTLAVALGFGLNSLAVVQAADNNVETPASDKINKNFIEQFPFAEKFTDKDGITAVKMKSPDVPLVNKEKGYSKEVVRVINYKQGAAGTVINRIYQYVRFYGAPVHEVPKDSPVNDVPEYNGGANPIDPPILEKPEYNGRVNPIDPPILEKPELNFEYKLIEIDTKLVITIEDNVIRGGFGESFASAALKAGHDYGLITLGVPDAFIEQGSVEQLRIECGMTGEDIVKGATEYFERKA